jgi:DNA replication protein DnaC
LFGRKKTKFGKSKKGFAIGRLYYAQPASGERHYLRMLLNTVKWCKSFKDIRTINGTLHPTYKDACWALCFLDDDNEWIDCINEAAIWASGTQLWQLFITILWHCEVIDPKRSWDSTWEVLYEDMQYKRRKFLDFPMLNLTDSQKKDYAFIEIEKLMQRTGKSMKNYPEIEMPSANQLAEIGNRLMNEVLNYNKDKQSEEHQMIYSNPNDEQKIAFNNIIELVDNNQGKLIFVEGHGGTSKTYLWKAIATKLWSKGKIVPTVASCGIATLLLEGGRTAHSRFHTPLNTTHESTCDIKQSTDLAALLNRTSLILWDEAPMAYRSCFEALNKSLREILRCRDENNDKKAFGGMTVVFGRDFRQILLVVPKGKRG